MKKLILSLLAALSLLCFGVSCFADTLPSWYPEDVNSFEDFHNANAPRVVDDADLFTDEEEAMLTSKIEDLINEHGYDFVLYTDSSSYGLAHNIQAADFYQFNGYGLGDNYSGSVLMICMEPGNRAWYTAARGDCRTYYTEENINDIDDGIESKMVDGDYYGAMKKYISEIDELYTKGHISSLWLPGRIGIAAVIAVIAGSVVLAFLTYSMKKVRLQTDADHYIVPGSMRVRGARDLFLNKSVSRVKRESHKGGGGGGSSYSGGFSSSGGGSFSGGGRSF